MNPKPFTVAALSVAAFALVSFSPTPSSGQAEGEEAATAALVSDLTAQQIVLADNQAKIDARLASIAENVRIARIYAGRSR